MVGCLQFNESQTNFLIHFKTFIANQPTLPYYYLWVIAQKLPLLGKL